MNMREEPPLQFVLWIGDAIVRPEGGNEEGGGEDWQAERAHVMLAEASYGSKLFYFWGAGLNLRVFVWV